MKKALFLIALLIIPMFSMAQTDNGKRKQSVPDTTIDGTLSKMNWGALINRDFVSIAETFYDVHVLDPGWIIQVRFYGRNMSPLINQQRDGGKSFPFTKTNDSRIVAMEGLADGGIRVVLATGDRIGPFVETVSIKSGFYSYTFSIKGLVQALDDKKKDTEKVNKEK